MSTTRSLPVASSSTYIPPNVPQVYLRQMVVELLLKRGFEGAEAGALTEIERLLEHHITNLFEESLEYAHLTGRREVNVMDLVAAQEETGWGVKRMKRESRRRRGKAPQIEYEDSISSPPSPTLPSLSSLIEDNEERQKSQDEDLKPDLSSLSNRSRKSRGIRPIYSQDWLPVLPEKWTLLDSFANNNTNSTSKDDTLSQDQPVQITSALLDFIKLTATERGDIPPELGIVDYRRASNKDDNSNSDGLAIGAGKGVKRKWGVKGVSARAQ
ncbi:uncharacterized protein L201_002155 [Kwoniella dendrophila CBS 6074]|uniref:Bromodomain associated domain-containing protein n=1 Tax=Kwoniella dendrophila CBS 6074 TaxID=1295534 RepID=A0AAX4JRG7_9TREE